MPVQAEPFRFLLKREQAEAEKQVFKQARADILIQLEGKVSEKPKKHSRKWGS